MVKKETLSKIGVMRSGTKSGTYKSAKDMPTEFMMDGVYNADKDLVGNKKSSGNSSNKNQKNSQETQKTNVMAIVGFIFAFLLPLVGFILSIIGLVQINKKGQKGKGLAIAGIIVSVFVAIFHAIITAIIIAAIVSSNSITLQTYNNTDVGYSVKYPQDWEISQQNVDGAKSVVFKDSYKETGKVYGQEEVVYIAAPPNGYSSDVLTAIADSLKKDNPNTNVVYQSRDTKNGLQTETLIVTYDGQNGKIKAKHTIILNKDNSVYTITTQTPEQNWDKYQDSFDEIHNTFQP